MPTAWKPMADAPRSGCVIVWCPYELNWLVVIWRAASKHDRDATGLWEEVGTGCRYRESELTHWLAVEAPSDAKSNRTHDDASAETSHG